MSSQGQQPDDPWMRDPQEAYGQIENLLGQLRTDPTNVRIWQGLREAGVYYKAAGGRPVGMFASFGWRVRDPLERLIRAQRRWSLDVGSIEEMERVMRALAKLSQAIPAKDFESILSWLARLRRLILIKR
jgi:hypothetical protein